MRPLFVILDSPPSGRFPYFIQVAEQVQIEDLVSLDFVKTLDVSELVRFAWLNELNRHANRVCPGDELAT
jgi:hypothetical protein